MGLRTTVAFGERTLHYEVGSPFAMVAARADSGGGSRCPSNRVAHYDD
jgi:hypothetical protein